MTAQTAVEVYVERVMTDLATHLGPAEVGEATLALVRSFTLTTIRHVGENLVGDELRGRSGAQRYKR